MKNVFDIDVNKGTYDGNIFCTKEVSLEVSEKIDESYEELDEAIEKTQQSWFSVIIEILCMILVGTTVGSILENGLKECYANAPVLVVITPIAAIIWFLIFMNQRKKNKNAEVYLDENHVLEDMDYAMQEVAKELGIPDDSQRVDILGDVYEIKRGKKKSLTHPVVGNDQVDMYIKGEFLCFADAKQELSISLADITRIEKVKKHLSISDWNKEEDYKSKKYKKYKIEPNSYGLLIKGYYSIQINSIWGEFEVRLPNYEEDAVLKIEEITGKKVLE